MDLSSIREGLEAARELGIELGSINLLVEVGAGRVHSRGGKGFCPGKVLAEKSTLSLESLRKEELCDCIEKASGSGGWWDLGEICSTFTQLNSLRKLTDRIESGEYDELDMLEWVTHLLKVEGGMPHPRQAAGRTIANELRRAIEVLVNLDPTGMEHASAAGAVSDLLGEGRLPVEVTRRLLRAFTQEGGAAVAFLRSESQLKHLKMKVPSLKQMERLISEYFCVTVLKTWVEMCGEGASYSREGQAALAAALWRSTKSVQVVPVGLAHLLEKAQLAEVVYTKADEVGDAELEIAERLMKDGQWASAQQIWDAAVTL